MRQGEAEEIAAAAFAWVAADDELVEAFLGASGAVAGDLGAASARSEFLGAVLDFVLSEDRHVLAAAEAIGERPERIVAARSALPGGALPHWT